MVTASQIKASDVKEQVSLVDLLARLGFQPLRKSGKETIYLSMLRDSDTTPSFSVNDKMGTWYDHGAGRGGNIIDFGLQFWKDLSFPEVLEKIVAACDLDWTIQKPPLENRRKEIPVKVPHYLIQEIKELGNNSAITGYLETRGIWLAAQGTLKELYYYVESEDKQRKHFFAAGWQNDLGAWEVRNINFKGCLGHKAISFIQGDNERLSVFEGFVNYLSYKTDNPFTTESALILNSISLLQAGIEKATSFADVSLFFDNDAIGQRSTLSFIEAVPHAIDCSSVYHGYNDYNDKLIAELNPNGIER